MVLLSRAIFCPSHGFLYIDVLGNAGTKLDFERALLPSPRTFDVEPASKVEGKEQLEQRGKIRVGSRT